MNNDDIISHYKCVSNCFYNRWMCILISKHALKHHIIHFYNVVDISSINNFFNVKYDMNKYLS